MPKTEYDIDGKAFHIEKTPTGWRGWFRDSELEIYEGELKRNVLITAGYKPLQPSGIVISSDSIYSQCEFRPPRTMEVAYQEFLKRLSSGKKPAFRKDKSLHKFVIFARDDCVCFYCEQFIEKSTNIHLDHLVPRSKGGTDSASNIVTSCHKCNLKKSNSILHDLKDRLNELHSRNKSYGIDDDHLVEFFLS